MFKTSCHVERKQCSDDAVWDEYKMQRQARGCCLLMHLFTCVPIFLYLCICISIFVYLYLYICVFVFLYLCICISIFLYLYAERRARVKGVDYTKAGEEGGLGHCDSGLD